MRHLPRTAYQFRYRGGDFKGRLADVNASSLHPPRPLVGTPLSRSCSSCVGRYRLALQRVDWEGHTLSQRDLDEVVYGVLQRFITDRKSIEDFHVKDLRLVRVRTQQRVGLRASAAAFPLVRGTRFVDMTLAELKAETTETQKTIAYISFGRISSDGSCAVLEVGGDVVYPDETSHTKYGCSEKALWERVNGRWMFAQSVYSICG